GPPGQREPHHPHRTTVAYAAGVTEETQPAGTHDSASPARSSGEDAGLVLIVLHTPDATLQDAVVPLEAPLRVGRLREPEVDLAADDDRMSRRHAILRPRRDGSGAELEDLDSSNGTFVDGARVRTASVEPGAVLRLGDTFLAVDVAPGDPVAGEIVGRSSAL